MRTSDTIRNELIGKLMTISDKNYLTALHQIVENSAVDTNDLKLTSEQKLMLDLSEEDIKLNKTMEQSELDKNDLKWLKSL